MSIQSVLLPVLVQVALVFVLLGLLVRSRVVAIGGGLRSETIALDDAAWPVRTRQLGRCYANQFEMPVLFLLAVIFGIVLHQTGWLFVLFEWLFVAVRIGHAIVHTTSNTLRLRSGLFAVSAFAVGILWLLIVAGVFFGGLY